MIDYVLPRYQVRRDAEEERSLRLEQPHPRAAGS